VVTHLLMPVSDIPHIQLCAVSYVTAILVYKWYDFTNLLPPKSDIVV